MKTWYAIAPKSENKQAEISIFDEIGMFGVSAKSFLADLQRIPADHTILLKIHSPGGEVFDGNAIFNALQRRGNVEVQIEGIAASMATVISLAGAPVKMAANGFYMIHNPWGVAMGDAEDLRDQAALLDKIRANMVSAYAAKSGQSTEQITEWMDDETWFSAAEAQAAGFVDEVTDEIRIAASANRPKLLAKYRNTPAALLTPEPPRMEENENQDRSVETEILEDLQATVVSENAPETVEAPAAEPAVEPVLEAEPTTDPEVIEPIETPIAKIASADQIHAKYNAALAERDAALTEARSYKAQLECEREALQRLERSLGLSAARVVPVIENASPEASDPVAEYIAAVESGDRKTASALFEKHKAAIWQHRNKISKA
jgi:ATP-dependent Clp endopeptidase proteolytic subunit ClpP